MAMRLFWSSRSPFVRKVMVAAHELGVADQIDLVPTLAMTTRQDPLLVAINPLVQIPTLVPDGGGPIFDSNVICGWLDERCGGRLIPADPEKRRWALQREALADGALALMLAIRAEERRPAAHREAELLRAWQGRVSAVMDTIETQVGMIADGIDLGTIAVAVMLAYHDFRMPDDWRRDRPGTAAWYAHFAERPSMRATAFAA